MAFPYKLYGGATRPDALNFNDPFNQAMVTLYNAAPPSVQAELGLTSGFRSRAVQEALWAGSDKTGHSVARPGHSKHESGNAADLYGFGLKGGGPKVSEETRAWVHGNADKFGLYFPMGHEPWHIQLRKAGGGGGTPTTEEAAIANAVSGNGIIQNEAPVQNVAATVNRPSLLDTVRRSESMRSPIAPPAPIATGAQDITALADLIAPNRDKKNAKAQQILSNIQAYS